MKAHTNVQPKQHHWQKLQKHQETSQRQKQPAEEIVINLSFGRTPKEEH